MKSKRLNVKRLLSTVAAAAAVFAVGQITINAYSEDGFTGWKIENGVSYWYEQGEKQGLAGRGKEIYDPDSNAWYWLDSVDGGKKAVSKDVYQESSAGKWAENKLYDSTGNVDYKASTGKWVRYDENGHMVKGWDTVRDSDGNERVYYFDTVYGTMCKENSCIDGYYCVFDSVTGVLIAKTDISSQEAGYYKELARQAFDYQNEKRTQAGVRALNWNEDLYNDICQRGPELAKSFSHERPDQRGCLSVITLSFKKAGENIAAGYSNAYALTQGWFSAPSQRANMLNPEFTRGAVVCYRDENSEYGYYWAAVFID